MGFKKSKFRYFEQFNLNLKKKSVLSVKKMTKKILNIRIWHEGTIMQEARFSGGNLNKNNKHVIEHDKANGVTK